MVNKMITSLWRAASRSVSRSRAASIPSTAEQYPKFKTISTPKKTTRTTSTHGGSAPMTVLPAEPLAVRRKVPPLLPLSPFALPPLSLGTQSLSLLRTPRWPPGGSQARDREEGASGEETPSQARSGGSPPAGLEEKGCTTLRKRRKVATPPGAPFVPPWLGQLWLHRRCLPPHSLLLQTPRLRSRH
jgi:hypothetical protein